MTAKVIPFSGVTPEQRKRARELEALKVKQEDQHAAIEKIARFLLASEGKYPKSIVFYWQDKAGSFFADIEWEEF